MATIGHKSAVADARGVKFTGLIGYLMWGFVHVAYLVGWGNRLGTIYTWARALYLSKNRGHRVITYERANYEVTDHGTRAGRPAPILPRAERAAADDATAHSGP